MAIITVLAVGGVAVAFAAFAYGRSAAQQSYDSLLLGAAQQIAQTLALREGEVIVDLPVSAFELLSLAPDDRIVYAVFAPDGALITGYQAIPRPPGGTPFFSGSFVGEPIRLAHVQRPFSERGFAGVVDVVVGQTTLARQELAWQITRNALVAVAGVGALISVLAVLAVQSALSPLRRIERDIAARASQDLTPVDVNVPQEVRSLVDALNRFIARIDRQLGVMQNLIADASHQLRTPIAALRAQAELAAEEADPQRQRAIVARIYDRSRTLSRLTDQLLSHALITHRADSQALAPLDLRRVAAQAVEQADRATEGGPTLRLDLPEDPVPCAGDAFSLTEACKNLIANAQTHGVAPVSVRVARAGPEAVLSVLDRGEGLPDALWPEAATRFARSAGVSSKSAGLGLSIVQAVAAAHGGRMVFDRSPLGFVAAIHLPLGPEIKEASE